MLNTANRSLNAISDIVNSLQFLSVFKLIGKLVGFLALTFVQIISMELKKNGKIQTNEIRMFFSFLLNLAHTTMKIIIK